MRALQDRRVRQSEGVVFVEGIRQVIAAREGGHAFEAVLVDPSRLRSEIAWEMVDQLRAEGVEVATLRPVEFERISSRDNPVGLAATVRWWPEDLRFIDPVPDGLYLATDRVHDPGNLGTIIRTADSFGAAGVILHGGTDPGHPTALRASLGTAFRMPVHTVPTLPELFYWAGRNSVAVAGTSASASQDIGEASIPLPSIILLGSEGEGLDEETLDSCDLIVRIPMAGTATSLNVAVAAGILLYELRRRLPLPADG